MRKHITLVLLIAIFLPSLAWAQQEGQFIRKSVTSVESVWMKPGSQRGIELNFPFFERMVDTYIEMARFDYNELPESLLREFRDRANAKTHIDENVIARLLEETVGAEMLNILNDPELMEARGLALRDESAWQTFAATKARSIGLTVEELEILMNSSYLYLPFITRIELTDRQPAGRAILAEFMPAADSDDIYVYIDGGIVWFSVNVSPDGGVSISELQSISASAYGSQRKGRTATFQFGNDTWRLNDSQYALYDATQAWVRNLGVATQEISDFQLRATIRETLPRRHYSLDIGRREGVYVDDIFELFEVRLDEVGNESLHSVGHARIVKVGDNREESFQFSTARQLMGRQQGVGIVAKEYPRVGYDFRLKFGRTTGMDIKPAPGFMQWLSGEINESFDVHLIYSYNLARITGRSQRFLDLDLRIGFPIFDPDPEFSNTNINPILGSAYLGYTRKMWFTGRQNLGISIGGGTDMFTYKVESLFFDESLTLFALGLKGNVDYEILITPALSFNVGAGYRVSTEPFWAEYKFEGFGLNIEGSLPANADIDMGGVYVTAGINYSLRQLRFNLFGFLDGFREY